MRSFLAYHFGLRSHLRLMFSKKTGFHKKCSFENVKKCQNWDEMGPGWRWRAQIWSIWIENELIKRFKTLPGPGEAIFDQK